MYDPWTLGTTLSGLTIIRCFLKNSFLVFSFEFEKRVDKTRDKTCDWTDKDKEILLLALETYGESIPELQEELPHKTASDIQAVISFYKSASEAERNKELISNWLEILTYLEGKNAGMQLVSRALKYIAMFEKNSGSDVDVNEAMMFLSRVSDNQGAAELSDATGTFLLQVLKALARRLKSQDNTEAEEYFKNLRDIDKSKINDVFMNPLGVPKKMLRLTAADKKKEVQPRRMGSVQNGFYELINPLGRQDGNPTVVSVKVCADQTRPACQSQIHRSLPPESDEWDWNPTDLREAEQSWFTDGSKMPSGVATRIYGEEHRTSFIASLGKNATIFQADDHAIDLCVRSVEKKHLRASQQPDIKYLEKSNADQQQA
ncbi:unnamed protein product [Ceutorhynchus assimilis]|uniref:Uncharacterized protein n=1 Tax=Ceutorhynchus assimilis TaxID=467358 RepID=A0A9N9MF17_9CUCU|nr:unnamed protein product [Ceutorhynchus assimilis]